MWNSVSRCAAFAIVATALLIACSKQRTPLDAVRQFHNLAKGNEWDKALALVDLDAKCTTMFGALYGEGADEDKARTREILGERLKNSTLLFLDKFFGNKDGVFIESITSDSTAEVTQTIGNFSLIYMLRKGKEWRIVDRTHERDGTRPGVQRGVQAILGAMGRELGRTPTLKDVNERLERYLERTRLRTIRVQ